MVTVSGLKLPVASALFRLSKSGHVTLCRRSSAWRKLALYFFWSRRKRAARRIGLRRKWAQRRAWMHGVSLTSAIILAVAACMSAAPRNISQKTPTLRAVRLLRPNSPLGQPSSGPVGGWSR